MALRHAILAALVRGESSGYDLAKAFDVTVANYWTATPQQLYRELDRMSQDGLVAARVVVQEKRPNKRLFTLTDEGRAQLRAFVAEEPRPTAIRDELLVQIEAMQPADRPVVCGHVRAKLAASRHKLSGYERVRDFLLAGRTQAEHLAAGDDLGQYLTLARGISFEQENIRWCGFVLRALGDPDEDTLSVQGPSDDLWTDNRRADGATW